MPGLPNWAAGSPAPGPQPLEALPDLPQPLGAPTQWLSHALAWMAQAASSWAVH